MTWIWARVLVVLPILPNLTTSCECCELQPIRKCKCCSEIRINRNLFCDAYPHGIYVMSQDESPRRDRHKVFAFSSTLFSQSILCWQVRRRMSNKSDKKTSARFFFSPPTVYIFMHSISAKPARNSLVFTFKAVLSVNSMKQPSSLSGICWGFSGASK